MSTHDSLKLLTNTPQHTQPVILRQRVEEVLQDLALPGTTSDLLQLLDDLLLVRGAQHGRADDGGQLLVLLEGFVQVCQRLGDLVEGGAFDGGGVLFQNGFGWLEL